MARSLSSSSAGTLASLVVLLAVIGTFLYFQTRYLQPDVQTVTLSRYPIDKVVRDMAEGGPYDKAQRLLSSGSATPVPAPVVTAGDLGKSDLSKFNQ